MLDWATHTWYTVVKNRDLEAESASRAAALRPKQLHPRRLQEAASSQPEPEQAKLDGRAVTGGSWAAVDVSALLPMMLPSVQRRSSSRRRERITAL